MSTPDLWDDQLRDYRQRYRLPEQWVWDEATWPRVQFDGYMRVVLDLLPTAPADVLDIGCGPGFGAKLMCMRGYNVTGFDFSERAVAFGAVLVPEARLFHADARLLPQRAELHGSFDAATIIEVLEHIPPDFHAEVVRGAWAALRPGGVLVVSVPSTRLKPSRWDYKHFEFHEVTTLLERQGFHVAATVNQCQVGVLQSPRLWRVLENRFYDLKILRRLVRRAFLRYHNLAASEQSAGRFIVRGIKKV
jgi:2-polyprenyl-3-methyl-5-hydroxy-6-metoxy-1,4-benzoquinol methylase